MTVSLPLWPRALLTCAILASAALLTGCAASGNKSQTVYDLGPLNDISAAGTSPASKPSAPALPPITVADVTSAAWLDSQMMQYRLDYSNELQPRPYATSRWSMPPAQLLGQRLKARLAQAGGTVLSAADGAINVPLLRIEALDFSQRFINPTQSDVQISVRATVLNGRTLIAQKSFSQQVPAPTADAGGAARALADATDAMINDMMRWLATLPIKK